MKEPFFYLVHTPDEIHQGRVLYEKGWGNGYVALPPGHPFFGLHYDDDNLGHIDVHGGLTYAQEVDGYWVFGFDTAHYKDNKTNCDLAFLLAETKSLFEQLTR